MHGGAAEVHTNGCAKLDTVKRSRSCSTPRHILGTIFSMGSFFGTTASSGGATATARIGNTNKLILLLPVICLALLVLVGKPFVTNEDWRPVTERREASLRTGGTRTARVDSLRYVLVIDCGSSGTRMNAFKFEFGQRTPSASVGVPTWIPSSAAPSHLIPKRSTETRRAYHRVETEPGLSAFMRDEKLRDIDEKALQPLLVWAKAVVPSSHWADTPVYLLGTAGLRRLSVAEQEQVLGVCRDVLQASPFRFENSYARVIDGNEEGMYGWVALNAAEGTLGIAGQEAETIGALDLGGSSLEVTYYAGSGRIGNSELDHGSPREVMVGGMTYRVQTTSYGGAGLDDAYRTALGGGMIDDRVNGKHPCLNRGYVLDGIGVFDADADDGMNDRNNTIIVGAAGENGTNEACYRLADAVVRSLDISDSHSTTTKKFAAMSGFYVINHFFGLDSSATLSDVQKATENFCSQAWDTVLARHKDELAVETYCFRGAYVMSLLKDLGVQDVILGYDDGRVGGWPMGFALVAANANGLDDPGRARQTTVFAMVVVLVVVLLVVVTRRGESPNGSGISGGTSGTSNKFRRTRVPSTDSSRSLDGMEEGTVTVRGFTRSSTVSRKLNEISTSS